MTKTSGPSRVLIACLGVFLISWSSAHAANRLFPHSRMVELGRISVEVIGKGPDVILIPGLASPRDVWRATADRLKTHFRLHLVQVAGFAGEPAGANKDGPVIGPVADAIDDYIVRKTRTPVVLIGHSLGGTISLYLAERHPDHLSKVLIVDALPLYAEVMLRGYDPPADKRHAIAVQIGTGMMAMPDADYAKSFDGQLASYATSQADKDRIKTWTLASDRSVVVRAIEEDFDLDLRPGLADLKTPITLLYPDYKATGPGVDNRYRSAYAPARTVIIKRIDQSMHFIMFDQPQAFADAVDAFLKS